MQALQTNSFLQGGRYKIIRSLGQGGFGITYLAIQSGLERKVAIKEFFMKELCERDESTSHVTLGTEGSRETVNRFREKFLKEACNIAKLNHPNIVRIIDVFEENGTAYYVMEYAENGSLADKVKREGYLSEPVATRYILQIADALSYIHQQNMNHLDVKPANIMLNEKDEAVLIDFGLSKQYDATTGNQTSTTPVGISEGYAPMEQYKQGGVGEFSPETDIYALGATFFKLLTGVTPPSASDVNEDGVPINELKSKGVSPKAIDVICKAMEGRKKDRMKEVCSFISGLKYNPSTLSSSNRGNVDDEVTLLDSRVRKKDEENLCKNAYAKAGTEKTGTAHKQCYDTECDEGKINSNPGNGSNRPKSWIVITGAIAIAAVLIVMILLNPGTTVVKNINSESSVKNDSSEKQQIFNARYSNNSLIVNGIVYNLIKVQAGSFVMGDADYYNSPQHKVTLSSDYYIGKTEVTQALWKAIMGNNPSSFKGDNNPVENVSWADCQIFITKIDSATGCNFRLPTEAEWEFAAYGGNKSKHYEYSGSNNPGAVAWSSENSNNTTHIVATKQPNELGIYDMSGNVREWCNDWHLQYKGESVINPIGPQKGVARINRGGSWKGNCYFCPITKRLCDDPYFRNSGLGLRLAVSE